MCFIFEWDWIFNSVTLRGNILYFAVFVFRNQGNSCHQYTCLPPSAGPFCGLWSFESMSQITQIMVIVILSSLSPNLTFIDKQICTLTDCFFFFFSFDYILHNTWSSFYGLLRHETSHGWQNTQQTSMKKIIILSKKAGLSLWWKQTQI